MDANLNYGWERINNVNLVGGDSRTNQILKAEFSWRF
jgi:hypothetical protein